MPAPQKSELRIHPSDEGKLDLIALEDGDMFRVRMGSQFMLLCCDCGLRHLVTVSRASRKNEVLLNFQRDPEGTAMFRREKRRKRGTNR